MNDVENFIIEQKIVTPFDIREEFDRMSASIEDSSPVGVESELSSVYLGLSWEFSEEVMFNEDIVQILYPGPEPFLYIFLCHMSYFNEQIGEPENPNQMSKYNGTRKVLEVRECKDIEFYRKMREKERELDENHWLRGKDSVILLSGEKEQEEAIEYIRAVGGNVLTIDDLLPDINEKPGSE